jgi:sulfate adenylyltransferase subunit 2
MSLDHLAALEAESVFILREAFNQIDRLALLWSLGKDSNVMIWLARKAFFGRVPFPVVHLDTEAEFAEAYAFRDRYAAEWGLTLIADPCPPLDRVDPGLPPATRFAARKSEGLKACIARYGFQGLIAGIRRDEQKIRAKERFFSPRGQDAGWDFRDQPPEFWNQYNSGVAPGTHLRVHPLLSWTEIDIWRYIARERIPVVPLYFARDGYRYRSLGEVGTTLPIPSQATTIEAIIAEIADARTDERGGRVMDHEAEDAFERLRASGYL